MAANNYFGFTHSGTQYAPTGATPYQTTQPGYAAMAPSAAAASYPQRAAPAAAYETAYPAAAAASHAQSAPYAVQAGTTAPSTGYDYAGYAVARTTQPAYDQVTAKTYYQQQATATAATYASTDYTGSGGGAKPPVPYSGGSYAGAGRGGAASQKPAAVYVAAGNSQPPNGAATQGAYAATAYGQQQQSQQSAKLIASSLHRNLSSVAEYAQPTQQRTAVTFAPKQAKKPFQSSGGGGGAGAAAQTGSVAAVTSYQQPTAAVSAANYGQTTFSSAGAAKTKPGIVMSKPATATYTNYDAALYSAASMYVAQQTGGGGGGGMKGGYKKMGGGGNNMSKPARQKLPPKPQQLHYCDVCKISCAGPQTYKEHLEGQKHKKKEASMKAGSTLAGAGMATQGGRAGNALRCELCDVTCTGSDAYAAHIRGAKHQKVVKLHTKLGKPIPAIDPKAGPAITGTKAETTVVANKINFVASGNLGTVKAESGSGGATSSNQQATTAATAGSQVATDKESDSSATAAAAAGKNSEDVDMSANDNITPVGHEYIEEILNDEGKPISFNCKLCECKFNDPNAKLMHMKGRRHRLQFKKKVNPDLVVDVKTSMRQRRIHEEKQRKQAMRDDFYRRREEERMIEEERIYWEERRRYEEEMEYYEWYNSRRHLGGGGPRGPPPPPPPMPPPPPPYGHPPGVPPQGPKGLFGAVGPMGMGMVGNIRRLETQSNDDRHVIARHAQIYPKEAELQAVQKIVSHVEKALKLVSDQLTDVGKSTATAKGAPPPVPGARAKKDNMSVTSLNLLIIIFLGITSKKITLCPGVTLREALEILEGDDIDGDPSQVFIEPPDANIQSDADSGEEDGGGYVNNLSGKQLLSNAEIVFNSQPDKSTQEIPPIPSTSTVQVAAIVPGQLKAVAPDDNYTVTGKPDEAAIEVACATDPKLAVTITLTSPVVREQLIADAAAVTSMTSGESDGAGGAGTPQSRDPPDLLDKAKCLEGLAALRHAKWFQARVNGLHSCLMVIRVLRDLCIRNPTWAPLNSWAMELLAEKCVSSAGRPISVSNALRRIMEAVASGLLLSGPGLMDPCEKEPTDAIQSLTPQQREDITASAQHALRLMAFRQIHKVLGMEMLQPPAKYRGGGGVGGQRGFARKRRRDNSTGEGNESEAGDGKKDKKDETATPVKMEK
ncbi:zinc finger RNA-binding protein [Nilaparvata lugens]|uniref:zinc finger RNA-binding protein n=1 Tax=Nilaparvata lugens TaxID=108931 RepID=UPI00193D7CAE|nr:zinc finger RNA-binding protein [Nilaparvata lugens]